MKLHNPTHAKYTAALRAWPAAGGGVHGHLMTVANLAAFSGVPEAEGIEAAKAASPSIHVVARAHDPDTVRYLASLGADDVLVGEAELAASMCRVIEGGQKRPLGSAA